MAVEQQIPAERLEAFDRAVAVAGLRAGWRAGENRPHFEAPYPPRHWRWAEIEPRSSRRSTCTPRSRIPRTTATNPSLHIRPGVRPLVQPSRAARKLVGTE